MKTGGLSPQQENLKIQKLVIGIAVLLFLVKVFAYVLTHSVAILTDALEGTVNVVAGFIGLYSLYVAAKPRDIDHPYGHGKAEFISAAVEGVVPRPAVPRAAPCAGALPRPRGWMRARVPASESPAPPARSSAAAGR